MRLRFVYLIECGREMEIKVVKLRVVKGSKEVKSGRRVHKCIGTQE